MTEDDLAKARLALLAVRAALSYAPDARGVERYFLRGSRLPMSAEAAARALARLEKPQRIEASRVGSEITSRVSGSRVLRT